VIASPALDRELRSGALERIDLKASILLGVCSLALAALVHAAAYLHWDPRELLGFQWFLCSGIAFGGAELGALAAAVWPRLGHGGEGITYFGHIAQFKKPEELNSALDREVATNPSRTDHAAKRLLAMSRIVYDKYRYIRWGMGLFGVSVLLCAVTAVRALTI
jgi:pycsar effector protein